MNYLILLTNFNLENLLELTGWRMNPVPSLQIYFSPRLTLTFDLPDPKVYCFTPLPNGPLIASKSIILFSKYCSQVRSHTIEWMDGQTC